CYHLFCTAPATHEIYTLSLHDALPILLLLKSDRPIDGRFRSAHFASSGSSPGRSRCPVPGPSERVIRRVTVRGFTRDMVRTENGADSRASTARRWPPKRCRIIGIGKPIAILIAERPGRGPR